MKRIFRADGLRERAMQKVHLRCKLDYRPGATPRTRRDPYAVRVRGEHLLHLGLVVSEIGGDCLLECRIHEGNRARRASRQERELFMDGWEKLSEVFAIDFAAARGDQQLNGSLCLRLLVIGSGRVEVV